jgi:hypothetical protein
LFLNGYLKEIFGVGALLCILILLLAIWLCICQNYITAHSKKGQVINKTSRVEKGKCSVVEHSTTEHLPRMGKALGLSPSITKKKPPKTKFQNPYTSTKRFV